GEILDRRDPSHLSHGLALFLWVGLLVHLRMPEVECAMLFEGRHSAQNLSLIEEARHPPLENLLGLRTRGMHPLADVDQDWLREIGGLLDISVDLRNAFRHISSLRWRCSFSSLEE